MTRSVDASPRLSSRIPWGALACAVLGLLGLADAASAQTTAPLLNIDLPSADDPDSLVPAMKILGILTVLTVAPAILLMMTSFTRILVVLSFVRQALGTQTMPPNQVIIGLSLFLTLFTMAPVLNTVYEQALGPYLDRQIDHQAAIKEAAGPMRSFMLAETRSDDLGLFYRLAKLPKPQNADDVAFNVLLPAFMVSELKTAFAIGFYVYVPFLIIDMVISSILMAMGMMMLPPTVVSLPFKLVLFVLVDGWSLIVESLVRSFRVFT